VAEGDRIQLSGAAFGLTPGTEASVFGASGDDTFGANELVHYNSSSGALLVDTNGASAGGVITLATLDPAIAMTSQQIQITA
jgi:hypothetical protein